LETGKREEVRRVYKHNPVRLAVFLAIFLSPALVLASDDPGKDAYPENVQPSLNCPLLFGDAEARRSNRIHRLQTLHSVKIYDNSVVIVHHTDWDMPEPADLAGIEIVEIDLSDASDPVALVSLTGDWDPFDCRPGNYAIHVDDSIGSGVQVIAILPDTLLLEYEDSLYFMSGSEAENHDWRMAWASPWKMIILPDSRSSGTRPGRAKARHTSRSKYRKKRR
jgi:hypothetical protein